MAVGAWVLLFATVVASVQVAAQGQTQRSAAERCFEHHQFGRQPVDVAKSADGQTVLAQVSWGYHDAIGCYLGLDGRALATLQAAPAPQSLPGVATEASKLCFEHHKFGERPVDVAKSANRQTVLARLSWGYHNAIGCYLTLDDEALATLRAAADTDSTDTDTPQAGPQFSLLATGDSHSCVIKIDQTIACWGDNRYGQTNAPAGQYTTIIGGNSHSCAIKIDQTIACWGYNSYGQIDTPSGRYTAIAAGSAHSCAINTEQSIACWGDNSYGQTVAPAGQYTTVAAWGGYSCAIRTNQTIACWGFNRYGRTDAPPGRYTAIVPSGSFACAIGATRNIACWGNNRYGRTDAPPGRYTAIATGDSHSCAIKTDQTIACWGNNGNGETDAPEGQYTTIAVGRAYSCAIRIDQTISCWGNNNDGQIEAPPGRYTAIVGGDHHFCAISAFQTIACWGNNQQGQSSVPITLRAPQEDLLQVKVSTEAWPEVKAGGSFKITVEFNRAVSGFDANDIGVVNGDVTHLSGSGSKYEATVSVAALGTLVVLVPRAVALDEEGRSNEPSQPFARTVRTSAFTASAIAAGANHTCAVKADQTIACWGDKTNGKLVAPTGRHTAITAGENHTCALRADQTIACWGDKTNGKLVAPTGRHTAITAGENHTCALRINSTIACWGNYIYGQTDAPAGSFTDIATGGVHSCAIRVDQSIACWGDNHYGQADAPSGQYSAIAASNGHTCALRINNTIVCWGSNDIGSTDAPSGQFTAIAAISAHSCAIRTNQTIACWGYNLEGQTDAPEGQYTAIALGDQHSCALRINNTIVCWGNNDFQQTDAPEGQYTAIALGDQHSCAINADATIACWGNFGADNDENDLSAQLVMDFLKANIIDRYGPEHPWLQEVWNYFLYSGLQFEISPHSTDAGLKWRHVGNVWEPERAIGYSYPLSFTVPDTTLLSSDYVPMYVRELAHAYLESASVLDDPTPIAIAQVYFHRYTFRSFGEKTCYPVGLIVDIMVQNIAPAETMKWWQDCATLPDQPDVDAISVVRQALAGELPEFLNSEFTSTSGELDYGKIWACAAYYYCERFTGQFEAPRSLINQLNYAFGGYCSSKHVKNLADFTLELSITHPWRDGGCGDATPTQTPGFETPSNRGSRIYKSAVDRYITEHHWVAAAWELTNRSDYKYIPILSPYGGIHCGVSGHCVSSDQIIVTIGWYPGVTDFSRPPTSDPVFYEDEAPTNLDNTVIHELAHEITLRGYDLPQAPAIAIGWLYFRSLHETLEPQIARTVWCATSELYAQAAVGAVFPEKHWVTTFTACPDLTPHSAEAITVARDTLNGVMPDWFYTQFGTDDGGIDYVRLWESVKAALQDTHALLPFLKDAFGGYCFDIDSVGFDLPENARQPWVDGGCPA